MIVTFKFSKSESTTPNVEFVSLIVLNNSLFLDFSRTSITSPTSTKYDGMSTCLPFTSKWPCVTICLASLLVLASPDLNAILSSLLSQRIIRFSPVCPCLFEAFS